jgi:hypothetical protein
VEKPLEEFYTHARTKDGKGSWCKKCLMAKTAEKRKDPVQKELWKEYGRRSILKKRYGITADQYDKMIIDQNNGCAICGSTEMGGRGEATRLAVDHNHKTGKVRGLLCTSCNNGLGRFKDDPELLVKAATYLRSYESSQSSRSSSSRACLS